MQSVGKLDRRVPFVQEIHLRPFSDRHHPQWETTRHTATRYRTTKLDYFLSKHHKPNIKRHSHHFFAKKWSKDKDTMTLFQTS